VHTPPHSMHMEIPAVAYMIFHKDVPVFHVLPCVSVAIREVFL
jgi:hypothetical protein